MTCVVLVFVAATAFAVDHADLDCRRCHGTAAVLRVDHLCAGCHPTDTRPPSFHAPGTAACTRCHQFHAPDTVTTARGDLSLSELASVDRGHCQGCHRPGVNLENLSPGHVDAATLYHTRAADLAGATPSQACLACHGRDHATSWRAAATVAPAFAAHTSHPWGVAVRPGQMVAGRRLRAELDPRLVLPAGQIECVTCHDITAVTLRRLVPFASATDLCLGCHDFIRAREIADLDRQAPS